MKINKIYLEASFISFLIHALIILYLLGFFYIESKQRSILSKPVQVNLLFQDNIIEKEPAKLIVDKVSNDSDTKAAALDNKPISFDSLISSTSVKDLIEEESMLIEQSEQSQIEFFSSLIIQSLQSAWRKPINIQDGLVCDLRLTINKNGRIINSNLIKSSGNIRFDNSALNAIQRVETFNFFNNIPFSLYSSDFKNIVITFNPS
ncbi:MAG: TonB family protein [SAR86 cluster bacterium]|uniref:TonB family protein n=1 Tax=SAR86 cluster bacterium TaxID=2030880 RepID=A0A520MWU8_9GAMM|nr:MAG: TonB family protein [SAR86 cluster bacterium]|tara:strand:+ start:1807 stop:2421 length:615 start_codon:yes stop_codon:yes gene_type:complete